MYLKPILKIILIIPHYFSDTQQYKEPSQTRKQIIHATEEISPQHPTSYQVNFWTQLTDLNSAIVDI